MVPIFTTNKLQNLKSKNKRSYIQGNGLTLKEYPKYTEKIKASMIIRIMDIWIYGYMDSLLSFLKSSSCWDFVYMSCLKEINVSQDVIIKEVILK